MVKIKLCGFTRPEDIKVVNEVRPDYIGFVFAKSRRQVNGEKAAQLKKSLDPGIKAVGVFVNEEPERIARLCMQGIIDLVQLHGDEEDKYVSVLRSRVPNQIIRAIRMRGPEAIKQAEKITCDYLLLDAYHKEQYGGSGESFNWTMIGEIARPYFLAGGIDCDNVIQAITQLKPYGVDISSGIETDGQKDARKIREIVTRIRSVR